MNLQTDASRRSVIQIDFRPLQILKHLGTHDHLTDPNHFPNLALFDTLAYDLYRPEIEETIVALASQLTKPNHLPGLKRVILYTTHSEKKAEYERSLKAGRPGLIVEWPQEGMVRINKRVPIHDRASREFRQVLPFGST